jgi:protoheme IX farnesyltransferase
MFALIFMWTPPHFWALALFMRSDYDDAGVPMLTVTHGRRATRAHILAYTVLLVPVSLGLAFTSVGGPVYLTVALALNAWFLKGAFAIWRRDEATAEADS